MAIKKVLRAINTKGTPYDQPENIEFLIYEDENGSTSLSLDGETLNAEKISQIGSGGSGDFTPITNSDLPIDDSDIAGSLTGISSNDSIYVITPPTIKFIVSEDDNGISSIQIVTVNEFNDVVSVISNDAEVSEIVQMIQVGQWVDWTKTIQPDPEEDVFVTKHIIGKIVSKTMPPYLLYDEISICVEKENPLINEYNRAVFDFQREQQVWTLRQSKFGFIRSGFKTYSNYSTVRISSIFNQDYANHYQQLDSSLIWYETLDEWHTEIEDKPTTTWYMDGSEIIDMNLVQNQIQAMTDCIVDIDENEEPIYALTYYLSRYSVMDNKTKICVAYESSDNMLHTGGRECNTLTWVLDLMDQINSNNLIVIVDNQNYNVVGYDSNEDHTKLYLYCNRDTLSRNYENQGLKITATITIDDQTPQELWSVTYSAQFYDSQFYPGMEGLINYDHINDGSLPAATASSPAFIQYGGSLYWKKKSFVESQEVYEYIQLS